MVKLLTKYHKVGIRLKISCKAIRDQTEKPLWRTFLRSISWDKLLSDLRTFKHKKTRLFSPPNMFGPD